MKDYWKALFPVATFLVIIFALMGLMKMMGFQ